MTHETQKRVFLSYAREDTASARQLKKDLAALGVDIWFDESSLLPGQKWRVEIQKAIRSSDFFVLILSRSSVTKRGVVQSELRDALDVMREMPDGAIFIVPARIEPVEPDHEVLRDIQWVDLFDNWAEGVRRIGLTLFAKKYPPAQPSEVINLSQLAQSVVETFTKNDVNDRIKVSSVSDTAVVAADRSLINVVLRELLANALKHAAPDVNRRSPVLIEIESTPERAILQIRNRITANAESREQPAFKSSPGFGLWLARNAVIQCGGDLKIETQSIAAGEQVADFVATLSFPRAIPEISQSIGNSRGVGSGYSSETSARTRDVLQSSDNMGTSLPTSQDSESRDQASSINRSKSWIKQSLINSRRIFILLIFGVLIVAYWGSPWMRSKQRETASTLEQEIVRLNQFPNSFHNNQASEIDFTLYPNAIRGDGERSTIISTTAAQVLRLHLLVMMDKYQSYRSTLLTEDRQILVRVSGLAAGIQDGNKSAVTMKLPVQGLASGDYHIELSGDTDTGTQEIATYYFRLVNR